MRKPLAAAILAVLTGGVLVPAGSIWAQATPAAAAALPPVVWQLTAITLADGSTQSPDDPTRYTLQFLGDGSYRILADCNGGGGEYTQDGAGLRLTPPITTLMACPSGSLDIEYVKRLPQVGELAYDEADLVLSLSDGGSLRFSPALTGVVWEWQRFQGGDGTEVIPDDPSRYTVTFGDDGKVAAQVDCNSGRGSYTASDGQIDISALATTRMGCPDDSLGTEFGGYLDQAVTYVFRAGHLYLSLPADAGTAEFAPRAIEESAATPAAATPAN